MKLLLLLLFSITVPAFAGTVDCYSHGKKIFHGESKTILVSKEWIIVTHKFHDDVIIRNTRKSPECVLSKMDSLKVKNP